MGLEPNTGEIQWSDEHFRMEGYEPGEIQPSFEAWRDRVHPEDRAGAFAALETARDNKTPFLHEFRSLHPDGEVRWLLGKGRFFYDRDGNAERMIGAMIDVTDRKLAVERQRNLVAELQHRVRNILAVVRYVFVRTVESSPDLEEAAMHFRGRIDALARTQVVATQSDSGLVDFESLIRDELLSAGFGDSDRIMIAGPNVDLYTSVADPLGLAIHELTVNSIKFGALKSSGELHIHWDVNLLNGGPPTLTIIWNERKVPIVPVVGQQNGFGRELIEGALPFRLNARTRFESRPGGILCEIHVPLPGRPHGEEGPHGTGEQ